MKKSQNIFDTPLRKSVFWPPFILISLAVLVSIFAEGIFKRSMELINEFILTNFSLLFSYTSFAMVVTCILVIFSPLGKIKIGGNKAQPKFSKLSWFSIILCTTVAVGILFWGSAEPLFHFLHPPDFKYFPSGSPAAKQFSMGAIFLHWGFTPYAIYCIPALGVALAVYNSQLKFSLSSPLSPILAQNGRNKISNSIDMVCLFALVTGMSASLGAGILSISGGLMDQWNSLDKEFLLLGVTLIIMVTFIVSASSGINQGIKNLSQINFYFFLIFSLLIFSLGPTVPILEDSLSNVKSYAQNFLPLSLQWGDIKGSEWSQSWSVFNWANWMAWAPISALFLGKIAYGRTVREFILFNWIFPTIFCLTWMSIFGGSTLFYANQDPDHFDQLLNQSGPESIIYEVFSNIGWSNILAPAFILAMFISYVTAADSSTEAMASLSMKSFSLKDFDSDTSLKVIWGTLVGLLAWVMVTFAGIDGVKMLSSLGGLPALFLLIGITISINKMMWQPQKYFKN
ncbi:BCCT family transporter [Echinicola sp. 20G]|uniref:BCCT family transporter n=1 Tax=Echinicola sp. 20G TaxID=2781961 RepID=UPI00190FFB81|nr:BCCT family transporter [Echinicola sp. 20G]